MAACAGLAAVTRDRLRAAPAGKVAAGLAIRRWQPGQSGVGNLQADGQYTNLSVRQ